MPIQNHPAGEWTDPVASGETDRLISLLQFALAGEKSTIAINALGNCLAQVIGFQEDTLPDAHKAIDDLGPILHKALDFNWSVLKEIQRDSDASASAPTSERPN